MTKGIDNVKIGWNFHNSYIHLPHSFFTKQSPAKVKAPKLVLLNDKLAASLGLDLEKIGSELGVEIFAGNRIPKGALPIAQAYGGHQFGNFNMLGDGRALLLGEQLTPMGERYDIGLKGSGRTPYSRGGDGRAALGPMLREYIISEAMDALGIPTTRSLAVVTTGEEIYRETKLPGAILTRVAKSHIRVGTFQFAAAWCTVGELKVLADYTIQRHYPENSDDEPYLSLLRSMIKRQAELITKWQLVGFIHGVMNTDNMTVSGETIDYGPCAFMDIYNPETVFSSIDREGRYAYGNQPYIGAWNLARFAETLLPLLHENEEEAVKLAQDEIAQFSQIYEKNWLAGMRAKLGIFNREKEDEILIQQLLQWMHQYKADYTNTFRALTAGTFQDDETYQNPEFTVWYTQYQDRLARQQESKEMIRELMQRNNPNVIPRNHRVEEALASAEKGDLSVMKKLLEVLETPFAYGSEQNDYCTLPDPGNGPYRTYCGT